MPRLSWLLKSASFRLAALQTLLLLITFLAVGTSAFVLIRRAEFRAAHAEIEEYEDDITDLLSQRGVGALAAKAAAHRHDIGRDFRLLDAAGHWLVGGLAPPPMPDPPPRKFWATYDVAAKPNRPGGRVLAYTKAEPGGLRLSVGEYLSVRERQDDGLLYGIIGLAGSAVAVGLACGAVAGRRVLWRIDQMSRTVDAYAAGERKARIAFGKKGDADHDHLAGAINRMMDREDQLIAGLRQATSAIAHDLRKPLAHHNQEIAKALAASSSAAQYRGALVAASSRVDEVLQTFQALLHIAELQAGAPGLVFEPVDLGKIAAKVVEAYGPAAEEDGRRLLLEIIGGPVRVEAEPRVLGRMIANLVDNALTHTPAGTRVEVRVDGARRRLTVSDDGPGVPAAMRSRLFDRFFRADASRSAPGSGLGLSLALAATEAFGGVMWVEDGRPGLQVVAEFKERG